ncbi:predicted protein [Histoplasma capsulatum var. duboisii H88]|uniref:Predicted protein n=2 Tax=Ajellomyces capsulatus TaxID=5037 RepID=F0UVG9_AJEC8|nr:predicted protein [Histoplasma capsulatum H143]EGC49896.1 predicted protein [Histoplasma capsulatum var. duboisii H88]
MPGALALEQARNHVLWNTTSTIPIHTPQAVSCLSQNVQVVSRKHDPSGFVPRLLALFMTGARINANHRFDLSSPRTSMKPRRRRKSRMPGKLSPDQTSKRDAPSY